MKTLRCAIYTRKSSEEGLEQDFNSLHAQREACEAYIRSQAGEGWTCIRTAYDDGGISGGTMERPALKALLADIAAGKIDVVVVYKVDRLTRSLTDFSRIVEVFDKRQVAFVSITQAFNTTSSMGRLTLNVLLSFAQFEREVTGERIRDKIAASKKRGLWMGGMLPLGYDPNGRTLAINDAEAKVVRQIFDRYLVLGSVYLLAVELEQQGVKSKSWTTKAGKVMGGCSIRRGALYYLLSNRLYLGEIPHKDKNFPGQHPAIVDAEVFERVRCALVDKTLSRRSPHVTPGHFPLSGKLFDEDGLPMSPSTTRNRHGKRYRYYVSAAVLRGRRSADVAGLRRLPADLFEEFLRKTAERLLSASDARVMAAVVRATVTDERLSVAFDLDRLEEDGVCTRLKLALLDVPTTKELAYQLTDDRLLLDVPLRLELRGGHCQVIGAIADSARVKDKLASGLRTGHQIADAALLAPTLPPTAALNGAPPACTHKRRLLKLAYLAPDLQRQILTGDGSRAVNLDWLLGLAADLPASWAAQRKAIADKLLAR